MYILVVSENNYMYITVHVGESGVSWDTYVPVLVIVQILRDIFTWFFCTEVL